MKKPDADRHDTDPNYIRRIIDESKYTQREVARRIGIAPRTLRSYLTYGPNSRPIPYTVQYAIEELCR